MDDFEDLNIDLQDMDLHEQTHNQEPKVEKIEENSEQFMKRS